MRFAGSSQELANGRHGPAFGGFGSSVAPQASPGDGQNPWNQEQAADFSHAWNGAPACQRYVNSCISGEAQVSWLEHFFRTHMAAALGRVEGKKPRTEYRCLILGSNEGYVERALCAAGFVGPIAASDIAEKALARSAEKAREVGYSNFVPPSAEQVARFDPTEALSGVRLGERLRRCSASSSEKATEGPSCSTSPTTSTSAAPGAMRSPPAGWST
ncbi:MAG TPA: hypothetical protein VLW85_08010 [Myxococcales bacterium]|nr:hypothetical protein [Myxococcales bacterium]